MSNYKRYGLTADEYQMMLNKSGNTCYICGRPPKTRSLNIDHNHKTGLVRGLLCLYCNRYLIGRVTNPDVFLKAAEYLTNSLNIGGYIPVVKRKRKRRVK